MSCGRVPRARKLADYEFGGCCRHHPRLRLNAPSRVLDPNGLRGRAPLAVARPFVEAVGRDEAPARGEGEAERGLPYPPLL